MLNKMSAAYRSARAACKRADATYERAVARIEADYRNAVTEEFGTPFDPDEPNEAAFTAILEKPIMAWKKAMDAAIEARMRAYTEARSAFRKTRFPVKRKAKA